MINQNKLSKIIRDNVSGSYELLIKINDYIKSNIGNLVLIKESLSCLKVEMKNFEAVQQYINDLEKFLIKKDATELKKYVYDFPKSSVDRFYRIYRNLKPFINGKKNFFSLSNSQTVYEIIKHISYENKSILVTIAESRPLFEGRILAKKLLNLGIKIKLVLDCQLDTSVSESDMVLFGADIILSNGNLVNKVGSKSSALIAKHYNKPVYVVATENKFSNKKIFREKPKASKEIWNYSHKNLTIENFYFEIVPNKLITKIITEDKVY